MKTPYKEIDQVFDFKGIWDIPSQCGLKMIRNNEKCIAVVTELYQDNPGTSVTQANTTLAKQICSHFAIQPENLIYIEHNPGMNSKLSFYDEDFFLVNFRIENNNFLQPTYTKLTSEEIHNYLSEK